MGVWRFRKELELHHEKCPTSRIVRLKVVDIEIFFSLCMFAYSALIKGMEYVYYSTSSRSISFNPLYRLDLGSHHSTSVYSHHFLVSVHVSTSLLYQLLTTLHIVFVWIATTCLCRGRIQLAIKKQTPGHDGSMSPMTMALIK